MKPSRSLQIYIASSFRNLPLVQCIRDALTERGHDVLDWSRLAPPLPPDMTPDARRAALDSDERGEIFAFCAHACAASDLVIYLGPSGQDAACELGMAHAGGVTVFGLTSPLDSPGLILARAVTKWCTSPAHLLDEVEHLAEWMAENEPCTDPFAE